MATVRFGELEVTTQASSIVELEPTPSVVVSSDNNYLSHGGGVSKAIWDAAGAAIETDAAKLDVPLRLGEIVVTTGGDLCAHVFHVVTIDFDQNLRIRAVGIAPLVVELLLRADHSGADSIALPLLGSGNAGVSAELAANGLATGIAAAASGGVLRSLRRVVIATPDPEHAAVMAKVLQDRTALPALAALVRKSVEHVPEKIGVAMTTALVDLGAANRPWALVSLTELALRALGAQALQVLRKRYAKGDVPIDLLTDVGESVAKRMVRADGRLAEELPPGLALGQFLTAVRALRKHADLGLPQHVDSALVEAVAMRNRLAHGTDDVSSSLEDALRPVYAHLSEASRSDTSAYRALTTAVLGVAIGGPIGALVGSAVAQWRRSARPQEPAAPEPSRPPTPKETAADDAHVRRFVALVKELLPQERLAELSDELAALGYLGEPELRLLEYAVRHDDPAGWLADELALSVLRKEVESRSGTKPPPQSTARALAEQLMELLGFPRARRIEGLVSARRSIEAARTRVLAASANELNGLVLAAATTIERVVLVLLRFVCKAGFGVPPEIYFRDRHPGLIDPDRPLDRASLGTVLSLLEHLAKDFETSEEPRAAVLRKDLQDPKLVPKNATAMAQMRNQFAHLRDENARPPIHELRQRASAFFTAALELLAYFEQPDHRVFPRVIRVTEVRIDGWHRRIVEAEDEQGHAEYIFSSRTMMPGEVYYMHPLTNPFRVDPILVEAGDLASASTSTQD